MFSRGSKGNIGKKRVQAILFRNIALLYWYDQIKNCMIFPCFLPLFHIMKIETLTKICDCKMGKKFYAFD